MDHEDGLLVQIANLLVRSNSPVSSVLLIRSMKAVSMQIAFCGTGAAAVGASARAFRLTAVEPIPSSRWLTLYRIRCTKFLHVRVAQHSRCYSPTSIPKDFFPASTICAFDKVPEKLPDWWDDDDDDDDADAGSSKNNPLTTATRDASSFAYPRFNAGGDGNGIGKNGHGGNGGNGGGGHSNGDENDRRDNDDKEQRGFITAFLLWYTSVLMKYPILTKSITTGLMSMLGDLMAQRIAHRDNTEPFNVDRRRTFAISFWSLIFMGPALHTWFGLLNRTIVGTRFVVVRKVLIDQLFFAPFFITSIMVGTGALEGKSVERIKQIWKDKFQQSMVTNWLVWPLAQTINFGLVPRIYQTFFSNVVALGWNTIFMYITHDVENEEEGLTDLTVKQN